jgi:hypothetical protein
LEFRAGNALEKSILTGHISGDNSQSFEISAVISRGKSILSR